MARDLIPSDLTIKAIQPGDRRKRLNGGDGLHLLLCGASSTLLMAQVGCRVSGPQERP